jgi:V8-like Glu-specific endopeptidase
MKHKKIFSFLAACVIFCSTSNATASLADAETINDTQIQAFLNTLTQKNYAALCDIANVIGSDKVITVIKKQLQVDSVSVSSNQIKDLDQDGYADIADAQWLLLFTLGRASYEGNYRNMDVTGDYIVDQTDALEYLAYVTYYINNNTSAPYTSNYSYTAPILPVNCDVDEVDYIRKSPTTGAYIGSYTLTTPSAFNVNSKSSSNENGKQDIDWFSDHSNSMRTPISGSTLYQDNSQPGVVKIIQSSGSNATGFVVDDHVIATACHVVDSTISSIILLNQLGTTIKTMAPIEIHKPANLEGSFGDYALLTVEDDLSDYVMPLGIPVQNIDTTGRSVSVTGFPCEYGYTNTSTFHQKYTGDGYLTNATYSSEHWYYKYFNITYNITTTHGSSGSPVYADLISDNNIAYPCVIGIHRSTHSNSENIANRMAPYILRFYLYNPYLN